MLRVDDLGKAFDELKRLTSLMESVKASPECKFREALILEIQRMLDRESLASTETKCDVPLAVSQPPSSDIASRFNPLRNKST